jgi:hypothetical protein
VKDLPPMPDRAGGDCRTLVSSARVVLRRRLNEELRRGAVKAARLDLA